MMVSVAFLAVQLAWGGSPNPTPAICMDQPAVMEALEGENVMLPCTYTYPRDLDPVGEVRTYWRAGTANYCGDYIYNDTEGWIHSNYTNRVSLLPGPLGSRSSSFHITALDLSDSKQYCCRVHLLEPNSTKVKTMWQSPEGTLLRVRDHTRLHGYQPESIPAMEGDSIIIPCEYTYPGELHSKKNVSIEWAARRSSSCSGKFSQPPKTSTSSNDQGWMFLFKDSKKNGICSIQINNLKLSDKKKHYCCRVRIPRQDGGLEEWIRPYGTRLLVGGRTKPQGYQVMQPTDSSAREGENVTLSCTFVYPAGKDPYWIGVYWRVRQEQQEFIYHHDSKLVHASYRGRTELIGDDELKGSGAVQIRGVTGSDNNTYYCLVEFRFCNTTRDHPNNIVSVVKEGTGTRLSVEGFRRHELANTKMVSVVAAVTIPLAIFMALAATSTLILLCEKGQRHPKEELIQNASSPGAEYETRNVEYELTEPRMREEASAQQDTGNVVYASLYMDNPAVRKSKALPEEEPETMYAVVKVN